VRSKPRNITPRRTEIELAAQQAAEVAIGQERFLANMSTNPHADTAILAMQTCCSARRNDKVRDDRRLAIEAIQRNGEHLLE